MAMEAKIRSIHPTALYSLVESGRKENIVDVSSCVEYKESHALGARNLPMNSQELDDLLSRRSGNTRDPIYVVCRGGVRGAKVCAAYPEANLVCVEGGTRNWEACALPVVRDTRVFSIERQVRTIAGLMIATGCLLAVSVHPFFLGVPAFVGSGLAIAGLTNTCMMGSLLSKLPWNQVQSEAT